MAFHERFEHAGERTSTPLVKRASSSRDSSLDRVYYIVACALLHFWSTSRVCALCIWRDAVTLAFSHCGEYLLEATERINFAFVV